MSNKLRVKAGLVVYVGIIINTESDNDSEKEPVKSYFSAEFKISGDEKFAECILIEQIAGLNITTDENTVFCSKIKKSIKIKKGSIITVKKLSEILN